MSTLRAGQIDQRIAFDAPTPTQGSNGEEVMGWAEVAQVWASVEPIVGRERLNADQLLADMDTRIRVRWSPDVAAITPKHRIRHGARIYNIVSIAHVGTARVLAEIMCQTGTNEG